MAINRDNLKIIHADLMAAMQEVAKKHNLSVSPFRITFSDSDFRFTATFGDKSVLGDTDPKLLKDLASRGWEYGLDKSHIGKSFVDRNYSWEFVGMRASKAVLKRSDNGKQYTMSADVVAKMLDTKRPDVYGRLTQVPAPARG